MPKETKPVTPAKQPADRPTVDGKGNAFDGKPVLTVLVIEDHQTIAHLLSDFIDQQPGFECIGRAGSGKEGISLIKSLQPDMIMLDLQLGDISGFEVLEWLRSSPRHPKVFVFSALVNADIMRLTLRSKIDAFVEKGAHMSKVEAALQGVLHGEVYFGPAASDAMRQIVHSGGLVALEANDLRALRLIGEKNPIKSLASELGLSQSGAYKAVDRLMKRTGCKSPPELVNVAMGLGLVMPN